MPEQKMSSVNLDKTLDVLEDYTLDTRILRNKNYLLIQNVLDSSDNINVKTLERLLAICVHDLKEDMKHTVVVLNIINTILKKVKSGEFAMPDLVPSAVAVLNIIKTTGLLCKGETIQVMCFETFLSYPDETLLTIATQHLSEIIEVFDVYCHPQIPVSIRPKPCDILHRYFKILPTNRKTIFVKEFVDVWFSKIVPTIMSYTLSQNMMSPKCLETLEMLTEELEKIDYSENKHWQNVLSFICNPQKYPAIMKHLLETGNDDWHRLWILFIKLLKNQITDNKNNTGSPINSMLPIVEMAFKMDIKSRCRAFECWNVLIDNFSSVSSVQVVNKSLKLLIIPLRSNNAKVEETAMSKLNTWWHFIRRYQTRLEKHMDMVVIPFLNFCFGKQSGKSVVVPGQITNKVKLKSAQAFVEIIGHMDCDGCTSMPKLEKSFVTINLLIDNWSEWLHYLSLTISTLVNIETENASQQVTCAWKTIASHIANLPENNIRKDLFNDLLKIYEKLIEDDQCKYKNVICEALIMSVFDKEMRIASLLKTTEDMDPLKAVLKMVIKTFSLDYCNGLSNEEIINKLKPLTNYICAQKVHTQEQLIVWIFKDLAPNDDSLTIWSAFANSLTETEYDICPVTISYIIQWPLKSLMDFTNVKFAAFTWYTLFCSISNKIEKQLLKEVKTILYNQKQVNQPVSHFTFVALLAITLKTNLDEKDLENQTKHLNNALENIDDNNDLEEWFPLLVDTIGLMTKKLVKNVNVSLAKSVINIAKATFKVSITTLQKSNVNAETAILAIRNLLKSIHDFFEVEAYEKLKSLIIQQLKECLLCIDEKKMINDDNIVPVLRILFPRFCIDNDEKLLNIKSSIENYDKETTVSSKKSDAEKNKFSVPTSKGASRKSKKKDANIVDTVVENGEEYVVVNSNWKFNPKKLTENQKEKLQKKRNIPALYQDLSQSQDEFKLKTWRPDSQETHTDSSASKSEQVDFTETLKKIPGSDLLPQIMENLSPTSVKKAQQDSPAGVKSILDGKLDTSTPKKSRMALKDRVFRNVRNLIEKSTQNAEKLNQSFNEEILANSIAEKCNDLEDHDLLKDNSDIANNVTPTKKQIQIDTKIVNSAPAKINTDFRPSRAKRKPRKFEDSEIMPLKRLRNAGSLNDSESEIETSRQVDGDKYFIRQQNCENEECETDFEMSEDVTKKTKENVDNDVDKETEIDNMCKNKEMEKNEMKIKEQILDTKDSSSVLGEPNSDADNTKTLLEVEDLNVSNDSLQSNQTNTESISSQDTDTPNKSNEKKQPKTSSAKNSSKPKSRIEKALAIDMVGGHPFLETSRVKRQSPKSNNRRLALIEKLNKSKPEVTPSPKVGKKKENSSKARNSNDNIIEIKDSQDNLALTREQPMSEDFIESSQDSSVSSVSVRTPKNSAKKSASSVQSSSTKPGPGRPRKSDTQNMHNSSAKETEAGSKNKLSLDSKDNKNKACTVVLTKAIISPSTDLKGSQSNFKDRNNKFDTFNTSASKDDTVIPRNKTLGQIDNLVHSMDTESIDKNNSITNEVIEVNNEVLPISICSEDVASADTEPFPINIDKGNKKSKRKREDSTVKVSQDLTATLTIDESTTDKFNDEGAASSFKDDAQRKQDFLNNTIEISPIKTLSPIRDKETPSPERSSDFVVIKLTSPVQSNGEPVDKCDSPEIFSEDKMSPDKRDQSPPRDVMKTSTSSPSSSLSLKKNRPQVRSGGRGAQMLGLCVPDRLQINNSERVESEEIKKISPMNSSARRNLRMIYNATTENNESSDEQETAESFLKFQRALPTADSSPAGPILKRKLIDIADEATVSPACKRKRVSFHDPPVSTTIAVVKYIEPSGIRSPQNSAAKRQERQLRNFTAMKSPKNLDNLFKLDNILTKAVESFNDFEVSLEDTDMSSLDNTPAAELVKTSDLNDTDPICPELIDCTDPIENIAADLTSHAMCALFIKEYEGHIDTVADLAKMTELEVNRLSIKAPKVKIAKKVLNDYFVSKMCLDAEQRLNDDILSKDIDDATKTMSHSVNDTARNESIADVGIQPLVVQKVNYTQTEAVKTCHLASQTEESGSKSTSDIVDTCIKERKDFIDQLALHLDESSKQKIASDLTADLVTDVLMKKITTSNSRVLFDKLLSHPLVSKHDSGLSFLQDRIFERFDPKSLILFCSQLLQKIHNKQA